MIKTRAQLVKIRHTVSTPVKISNLYAGYKLRMMLLVIHRYLGLTIK